MEIYNIKHSLTQPFTKITPYTLKRITFTTSRASEMKTRTKEALLINFYSEKYIRIVQIQNSIKMNIKRKLFILPLFLMSLLYDIAIQS